MPTIYHTSDKMYDVIQDDNRILQIMSRMGLPLGFGEKTVQEVCENSNVDPTTFLTLTNYSKHGKDIVGYYIDKVSVEALMDYLIRCHHYFHNFLLPYVRRLLIEAINCSETNKVAFLIIKFYDEYVDAVKHHTKFENTRIFPYVKLLLDGQKNPHFHISDLMKSHEGMDQKLTELRNIVIKYYTSPEPTHQEHIYTVLEQIFRLGSTLKAHCELEDMLFVPAVQQLERNISLADNSSQRRQATEPEELSEREKELVCCIVQGLTNKEIAAKLYISVNTVITHRKNICRKLKIHSTAGLTIYAIVNDLVSLNDLKQNYI